MKRSMKLSWTIQWFDIEGNQTEISVATLLLESGQEFAAGYARILNDNGNAVLKVIQDHQGSEVTVGKQNFPVTALNKKAHTQLGEQEFKTGDVLNTFGPTEKGGAIVTTLTLLPNSIPYSIKLAKE